jgi:hypothetical protein
MIKLLPEFYNIVQMLGIIIMFEMFCRFSNKIIMFQEALSLRESIFYAKTYRLLLGFLNA